VAILTIPKGIGRYFNAPELQVLLAVLSDKATEFKRTFRELTDEVAFKVNRPVIIALIEDEAVMDGVFFLIRSGLSGISKAFKHISLIIIDTTPSIKA